MTTLLYAINIAPMLATRRGSLTCSDIIKSNCISWTEKIMYPVNIYILYPSVTLSTLHPPARHFVLKHIHAEVPDVMLNFWGRIFFFLILAHSVHKMWITQEPKKVALWNKLHFEKKKTESVQHV